MLRSMAVTLRMLVRFSGDGGDGDDRVVWRSCPVRLLHFGCTVGGREKCMME